MTHAQLPIRFRVASALRAAIDLHGAPNRFAPGELETYYGDVTAMLIGRYAQAACRDLANAGYVVRYHDRSFFVDAGPDTRYIGTTYCGACGGDGRHGDGRDCEACHGTGREAV